MSLSDRKVERFDIENSIRGELFEHYYKEKDLKEAIKDIIDISIGCDLCRDSHWRVWLKELELILGKELLEEAGE